VQNVKAYVVRANLSSLKIVVEKMGMDRPRELFENSTKHRKGGTAADLRPTLKMRQARTKNGHLAARCVERQWCHPLAPMA